MPRMRQCGSAWRMRKTSEASSGAAAYGRHAPTRPIHLGAVMVSEGEVLGVGFIETLI
jgi:hypothetical protein